MKVRRYDMPPQATHGSLACMLLACTLLLSAPLMAQSSHSYPNGGEVFTYTLTRTGENFSFEFERNPGKQDERLKAAVHVLQTAYDDASVNPRHSSFFTKEGAKCFVFESTFYSYTSCFLPNDYSPGNEDRFWGFVTRVPNALWLVTRNLLPALFLLGGFAFFMLRKPGPNPAAGRDSSSQHRPAH